jgi:hypothetical protein
LGVTPKDMSPERTFPRLSSTPQDRRAAVTQDALGDLLESVIA